MQANITQLISYPIKSCAGINHHVAAVTNMGLLYDRHWMLVDPQGVFISQRKFPRMALIQPAIEDKKLWVNAPGMPALSIQIETDTPSIDVIVWNDTLTAQLALDSANKWFSNYLGTQVFLVRYGKLSQRQIDLKFAQPGQNVAFADGFPLLVCHQSSLNSLNQTLNNPVSMNRFRPNVVIATEQAAWAEFNWHQLSNESMTLDLVKPSERCVITGVEQSTGIQTGTEVLKTLKNNFPHQDKAIFGINAIPDTKTKSFGQLAVGMTLQITQHHKSK